MALTDLPLDQLRSLTLDAAPPADLEEFWRNTITEAREHPLLLERSEIESPLRRTTTWDITFNAWGGSDTQIEVYPWNGHEGGRELHTWKQPAEQFG